ncbi:hypothetical protein RJ55_04939 [Drechmeria coniospora]|nr:hypothetical protein RJ55_04939 [Drechmeria coniospora]
MHDTRHGQDTSASPRPEKSDFERRHRPDVAGMENAHDRERVRGEIRKMKFTNQKTALDVGKAWGLEEGEAILDSASSRGRLRGVKEGTNESD